MGSPSGAGPPHPVSSYGIEGPGDDDVFDLKYYLSNLKFQADRKMVVDIIKHMANTPEENLLFGPEESFTSLPLKAKHFLLRNSKSLCYDWLHEWFMYSWMRDSLVVDIDDIEGFALGRNMDPRPATSKDENKEIATAPAQPLSEIQEQLREVQQLVKETRYRLWESQQILWDIEQQLRERMKAERDALAGKSYAKRKTEPDDYEMEDGAETPKAFSYFSPFRLSTGG